MVKDVLVTVKGFHSVDGEEQEPIVMTARGVYNFQNGKHYIRYDEIVDAVSGTVSSMIKFTGNIVEITRKTGSKSVMRYEVGKMNETHYNTSAGILELGILAQDITLDESDDHIVLHIQYSLHAGGRKVQDSVTEVSIVPFPIL